jgi:FAD-dependent urate hydroxylase
MNNCDVAIIGAGPYGLSTAAHLQQIKGLEVRMFGKPMDFWERCMPKGMLLRSRWRATHIADPNEALTLDEYKSATGNEKFGEPIPVSEFVHYGRWFRKEAGLASDSRNVARVSRDAGRYKIILEDGETLTAKRVVVGTGIECFAYKPHIFADIPSKLASHCSKLPDYGAFRGKDVAVIGGGQSALETGAFLEEHGARVEILVRQPMHCRKARFAWLGNPWWMKYLRGRGDVGPTSISLIIQHPSLFARFPQRLKTKWDQRASKLGISYRLVPQMSPDAVRPSQTVERAQVVGERLRLRTTNGVERIVDHAVLATGYRVNVAACSFLDREILEKLAVVDGYPRLDAGLESSVPGLHFAGAMAAYDFGPLMRFVAGTGFAGEKVAQRIRSRAKKERRLARDLQQASPAPSRPHARSEDAAVFGAAASRNRELPDVMQFRQNADAD